MKTLVVLCALASIAVAAPSYLAKDHRYTYPENWPTFTRRDKKSPQTYFYAESAPLNVGVPSVHTESELDSSSPTGRSIGLKKLKPTIIKRPSGYHLYWDSAEERAQADPSEDCSKQVQVKFCDGDKSRSIKEKVQEDDVHSSIKMAKEAIEHLQRDLKSIEQSPKSATWNERDEMQEDIEVARKALDHVHRNFGNLESMSLKSTLVDKIPSHEINDDSPKTHQERASQWKEHTQAFKSNVEGARNMEDIIEPAENKKSINIENIDTTKLMKHSEKSENLINEAPLQQITEKMEETHERHASTEAKTLSDMKPSETKMKETKMTQTHQLKSEKSAEHNLDVSRDMLEEENIPQENVKAKSSELLDSGKTHTLKISEHPESHTDGKLRTTEDNHQAELNSPVVGIQQITPAISQNLEKTESHDQFRKSTEKEWNRDSEKHLKQPKQSFFENQSMDTVDVMKKEFDENHFHENQRFEKFGPNDRFFKSTEHEDVRKANEHHAITNEDKLVTPAHLASEKSADNLESMKDKSESHNMHWVPKMDGHLEKSMQMKAATEFHKHQAQPGSMHHHFEPAVESSNQMDIINHPGHANSLKIHEQDHAMNHAKSADLNGLITPDLLKTSLIMDHAKSADFNGFVPPSLPSSMIDFSGKSAMDLMQWTHKPDGGRSAYGAYGGGGLSLGGGPSGGPAAGSGAVGVFPNAHVGGCAVPLLLSCSPSVVSGSLAKSGYGSSYGSAPAYRGAEEHSFHNKRDTKKFKDGASKKNIKQRTTITEKKI